MDELQSHALQKSDAAEPPGGLAVVQHRQGDSTVWAVAHP
jgi:hypothetical protein